MATCPGCGQETTADARFCSACGSALAPTEAREERKVVTVLFADLVGSTGRAEGLDPEDVRGILAPFHARLRDELERHGGVVEKFIGDAVVGVFGAPVSHEDDPERGVRAALAIHDAIAELNDSAPGLALEVRVAVNTGEALVELDARPELGESMVSGDVINTAARLQSAAPPGGILVGEQTRRATERAIAFGDELAIEGKGKAAPIRAWRVTGTRSSFGLEDDIVGRAALVGRERELTLLTDALARVRTDQRPQLVTLVGVPGIGKSRLVLELGLHVEADPDLITWRRGRSLPYGEGVAYWALGEIVKAEAGILESDNSQVAGEKLAATVAAIVRDRTEAAWIERHVRPLVGLSRSEGTPSRDESFAAWRRFLEALAEERPAVLVFEDLHWADDDLLDFVDELADELDAVPLLLVCTARPELLTRRQGWGGGKLNALTLSLAPLSSDDTARLLQSLLDRSVLPAETQATLIERAEGVPLFAEEYVRMLERGDVGGELPDTLQGIVAARIDGLPAATKEVLQDAAVLGKVFWTDALAELTGLAPQPLDDELRSLERQEFVRRERRSAVEGARQYVFLHAVMRDVAYGQIPRARRHDRHRSTADWITRLPVDRGEDRAETLAYHLEAAIEYGNAAGLEVDDLRPLLARAFREAGDRAAALNIVERAASFYRRAIEADETVGRDSELLFRYVQARVWAEGVEGGTQELEEAVEQLLADDRPELAALALTLLERRLWNAGHPAPERLDQALELVAGVGPTSAHGRVLGLVSVRWAISGRVAEALPLAEEAVAIARLNGDQDSEAEALNNLSVVRASSGDLLGGLETGRQSLALALECGSSDLPRPYVNLATFELEAGEIAASVEHHREGLALAKRLGNRSGVDWLSAELALDAWVTGDWDAALADARGLSRGRAERGAAHYLDSQLAIVEASIVLWRDGKLLDELLDGALTAVQEIGDPQVVIPTTGDASGVLVTAGRREEAAACLEIYRAALAARSSALSGVGSWTVASTLAWLRQLGARPPDEFLMGADVPWTSAARSLADGEVGRAADVMGEIGARTLEAELRLYAAEVGWQADPRKAEHQLDLASDFWHSVRATARLAAVETVRATLRAAAS